MDARALRARFRTLRTRFRALRTRIGAALRTRAPSLLAGLLARFLAGGRDAVARRFGIDSRALAAFRISLGALLLADLLLRARDLTAFYTDAGVLPRALLREQFPTFARVSLHAVSGSLWLQALLFLVAGGAALALLLGYRTTLATGSRSSCWCRSTPGTPSS